MKIDDPLDAAAVHGVCGIWGLWAAALFDMVSVYGGAKYFMGGNAYSAWSAQVYRSFATGEIEYMSLGMGFAANLAEMGFIILWSGSITLIVFVLLKLLGIARLEEEFEIEADKMQHVFQGGYMFMYDGTVTPTLSINPPPKPLDAESDVDQPIPNNKSSFFNRDYNSMAGDSPRKQARFSNDMDDEPPSGIDRTKLSRAWSNKSLEGKTFDNHEISHYDSSNQKEPSPPTPPESEVEMKLKDDGKEASTTSSEGKKPGGFVKPRRSGLDGIYSQNRVSK
jgi:hypothetical protein